MDNLRSSIKLIFGAKCPDKVFQTTFSSDHELLDKTNLERLFSENEFLQLGLEFFPNYTFDEIRNVYKKLNEDWFFDVYQNKKGEASFYHLLTHFNKQVLTEQNNEPFVRYKHLLRWRELSHALGEDLFTCSYLAYMDVRSRRTRHNFAWRPILFSTNTRLRKLLQEGMAENHFHLKGSAPFELSWMAVMNDFKISTNGIKKLKREIKLAPTSSHSFQSSNKDLEILVYKAAYIRYYLTEFNQLTSPKDPIDIKEKYLKFPSNRKDSIDLVLSLSKLSAQISSLKYLNGYRYNNEVADYAIPKNIHPQNLQGSHLLVGERLFLYNCFKVIYSSDSNFKSFENLFYAYLLIKKTFRDELIQINKRVGFSNFSAYQDRKEYFIPEGSIYEKAFLSMPILDSTKFQKLEKFELRISPKSTSKGIDKEIQRILNFSEKFENLKLDHGDEILRIFDSTLEFKNLKLKDKKSKHRPNQYFVLHFIKTTDEQDTSTFFNTNLCRHHELRLKIKEQARSIVEYRESYSANAKLIKGIDAASSELSARPEVFAQAYRYLKDHKLSGKYDHIKNEITDNKLMATFHAGEEFYDIVDGLRTIDEAIKFLKLTEGDRIGHALALGVNISDFYNFKGGKIMLPKEILLDNVVWILAKSREFNITNFQPELNRLNKLYQDLYHEIYLSSFEDEVNYNNLSFDLMYDAWSLRGDDPYLYINPANEVETIPNITYWERCRINYFYPKESNLRTNSTVKFLYNQYHFNPKLKEAGKRVKQFAVTTAYIHLVRNIQLEMQKAFIRHNIGIETNPTSNYLIGTFDKYSKHPIKDFYNLDLTSDSELLEKCPQIFVSINSDDQGIFNTSLENEYALLAIALEKEKDENGNPKYKSAQIYKWLDNIRKMGIEQSFDS